MRESLTVLAILLIVVFTAALAGPYFVDWNAQRSVIETRLSAALGETLRIRGPIELRLLPTPYLIMNQIEVADADAPLSLSAEALRFEIAVAPLLRGEIDFAQAQVQKPHLRLTLTQAGTLPTPRGTSMAAARLRFDSIVISDGRLTLVDPGVGRRLEVGGLQLTAQAGSLAGPYKGDGSVEVAGQPVGFRFSTGNREGDKLRVKFIVDEAPKAPRLDFDGTLSFADATPSVAGTTILSGKWRGPSSADALVPWRVSGAMRGTARRLAFDTFDLRAGEEPRAVSASGTAQVDLSASPKAVVTLRSKQIDLDRVLSVEGGPSPPQRLAAILDSVLSDPSLANAPLPLTVEAAIDNLFIGGEAVSDVSTTLGFDPQKPSAVRLDATGPARTHLTLDGQLESGAAAAFTGRLGASTGDLARLTEWLRQALPGDTLPDLPFRTVDAAGQVQISRVGFSGRDMTLRLDRSNLAGALGYSAAVGRDRARLFIDMTAAPLDIDDVPDFGATTRKLDATDLSIRFDARAVKLARPGQSGLDAGRIRLRLAKTGADVAIEDVTIEGLGGSNIAVAGAWNERGAKLDGKVEALRLQDAAGIWRRLAPGAATNFLAAQAAAISPTRLTFGVEATGPPGGPVALTSLKLDGTAGNSRITASLLPDKTDASAVALAAQITAPDAVALLRQMGVSVLPLAGLGPGRISMTARGPLGKPLDASVSASLAGANFGFTGSLVPDLAAPRAFGSVKLATPDLAPFLQAIALTISDPLLRLGIDMGGDLDWAAGTISLRGLKGTFAGASVSGSLAYGQAPPPAPRLQGALSFDRLQLASLAALALGPPQQTKPGELWSSLPFAAGLLDPPSAALDITAQSFDMLPLIAARDARFHLDVAAGLLALRDFKAKVANGDATGAFMFRRDGALAALEGRIALSDDPIDLPSLRGRLAGTLDVAGTGRTMMALVAGLAGSGRAVMSDIMVPHSDASGIERVFAAADDDRLTIDEAEVARALRRALEPKAAAFGTRTFDVGLAGGVLRLTPAADVTVADANPISANLDLRTGQLEQKLDLAMDRVPRGWSGPRPRVGVTFKGPLQNPTQTIEAAAFVNELAARAIARESARIEAFEFDLHERPFFNQRLQSERRREQERIKADDDARRAAEAEKRRVEDEKRKADEERRAAAEAARLDRLKKAEEARRKQEEAAPTPAPAFVAPPTSVDPSAAGRY